MSVIGKGVFVKNNAVLDSLLEDTFAGAYVNNRITTLTTFGLAYRHGITSVTMNELTNSQYYIFSHCTSLVSVSLPKLSYVGQYDFHTCSSLNNVDIPKATALMSYAFINCGALERLNLPKVNSIGIYAFQNCSSLDIIVLGMRASLTNVNAFDNCPAFIYVEDNDLSWYSTATNWSVLYGQGRIKSKSELEE